MSRAARVSFVVICALTVARTAAAADEGRREPTRAPTLHVYVSGSPKAIAKTAGTLRELCARLNLDVVVDAAPDENALGAAEPSVLLQAFVDLRSPSAPRLVVVDVESHREIERRTLPGSATLEMSVEAASHVIYMAAESALAARDAKIEHGGAPPGSAPEATPAPRDHAADGDVSKTDSGEPRSSGREVPRPAPPALEPGDAHERAERDGGAALPMSATHTRGSNGARFQSELAAFGSVATFAVSHPLFGLGGSLDAGLRSGGARISAALSGGAYFPRTLAHDLAAASLSAQTGRLSAVGAWEATPGFVPFVALGGGVDRVVVDADPPPPGVWTSGTDVRVDPVFEGMLGAKVRFSSSIGAFFGFAMDVDLAPHRYEIVANGVSETFFDLARVRPTALLGVSMQLANARGRSPTHEARR